MRLVAAGALTLHGLVHLLGFVVPWRLADLGTQGFGYKTTVLAGRLELGVLGARLLGLAWLGVAVAFVLAAVAVARHRRNAHLLVGACAVASLGLCLLDWPLAHAGGVIDIVIIVVLLGVTRYPRLARTRAPGHGHP